MTDLDLSRDLTRVADEVEASVAACRFAGSTVRVAVRDPSYLAALLRRAALATSGGPRKDET